MPLSGTHCSHIYPYPSLLYSLPMCFYRGRFHNFFLYHWENGKVLQDHWVIKYSCTFMKTRSDNVHWQKSKNLSVSVYVNGGTTKLNIKALLSHYTLWSNVDIVSSMPCFGKPQRLIDKPGLSARNILLPG